MGTSGFGVVRRGVRRGVRSAPLVAHLRVHGLFLSHSPIWSDTYNGRSQRERWSNLRARCRAARGPQHATRAHVQVASSRRDANPPRERSAEPTSPGREAAREASETRDAAPVNHLSPWIKASAPSSATSSPARARSAWRTTTKRCSRSSGSNTEGEARTDTTTRGTSSSPPRTPPRSSRKGNASARTPRRRNTRIEGAGSSNARYARSLTPESPTRARRPRRPRASVRPPSSDATPTPRATNRGKPHPIFGYRRSFRLIPRPTRPSPSRNPASTPVPTLHRPAGVLRA